MSCRPLRETLCPEGTERITMSGLSPELRQLVDAARSASRPTSADSARVLELFQSRLGISVVAANAAASGTSRLLATKAIVASIAGLALVIAGSALFVSRTRGTAAEAASASPVVVAVAHPETAVVVATDRPKNLDQPEQSAAPKPTQPAAAAGSPRRLSRARDSLSEEVAILSRAEQELHGGRAKSALLLLNEHERRFGNGALAEERTAARIQALCAIGHVTEANALMGRLSPNSLHGESTRQACATAKNAQTNR
jgi:hypothetical protein